MRTYRLHILRHGLTDANLQGTYVGHTDVPLCEQGRLQLLEMKEDYSYPQPSVIFTSPLKRCTETCELIFDGVTPVPDTGLMEYNFGSFEGRAADELHEKEPLFDRWLAGEQDVTPPFGESNNEFATRVCGAFSRIVEGILKTGTDDVYIVTHGGVIMTILSAFGLPELAVHDWMTPSGCGYTLRITPQLWMAGKKVEVIEELPAQKELGGNYYDGWDYYPEDNYDYSEDI